MMKAPVKHFILRCLIFMILPAITLCGLEWAVRTRVPNQYAIKHRHMMTHGADVRTMILGTSHTYLGIRASMLGPGAINLGNNSQSLHYDYILLRQYAPLCPNLKRVILPVSYFTFHDADLELSPSDYYMVWDYKIYMDVDIHPDWSKYNFELARPVFFAKKFNQLFKGPEPTCDESGTCVTTTLESRPGSWSAGGKKRADKHTAGTNMFVSQNTQWLTAIAEYCRTHNIELILITTPTWHTYYQNLDAGQLATMRHIRDSIADRYSLRVFDYLTDPRFNADDFYDTDHLNYNHGAVKLTSILKKDLAGNTPH